MYSFHHEYTTKLMDLTTTALTVYIGWAEVGTLTSTLGWTIQRIIFDANGNPLSSRWTEKGGGIWDNRVSATYL